MDTITLQERPGSAGRRMTAAGADAEGAGQSQSAFGSCRRWPSGKTCITQEIVDTTPLAQSTVSQHLKVLREAGLIEGEIEGPATCYCLSEAGVRWLKEQIEGWLPGCCAPSTGRARRHRAGGHQGGAAAAAAEPPSLDGCLFLTINSS